MILFVALVGAAGLVMLVGGIPTRSRPRLADRVDPYLSTDGRDWQRARGSLWARTVTRLWPRSAQRDDGLARRLDSARSPLDPAAFRVQQLAWGGLALCGIILVALLAPAAGATIEPAGMAALGCLAFASGVCGRDWFLSRAVAVRHGRITVELPVAIDLMTLTLMAGGSVSAACERVATRLPEGVGFELRRALDDMRTGISSSKALSAAASRLDHAGFRRLIHALCIGLEHGTPLADILRAQAQDIRDERRRRLLELGGKREVLMLVPVVFLILPTVVLVALFPALASLDLLVP